MFYPDWFVILVAVVMGSMFSFFMVKAYRQKVQERTQHKAEKEARKNRH